jgi:acetyltransferase-like isoleucine patch superfamily enzyme
MTEKKTLPKTRKYEIFVWLFYTYVLRKIPYSFGVKLRNGYARKTLKSFGKYSTISTNVRLLSPSRITIGSNVGIARDVTLDGRGDIEIGDFTIIGFESVLLTSTHNYSNRGVPIAKQGMYSKPVKIGRDCWIDARVMVLPGIEIGDGCIIGANSVVTKNIPQYCIAAGVPARVIKER